MREKEIDLRIDILLSTYSALIGRISKNVRMITIDWSSSHYYIRAYFSERVTDDDIDDFQAVSGEVGASFPNMQDIKDEVIYSLEPLKNLGFLKEMVFLRQGELD